MTITAMFRVESVVPSVLDDGIRFLSLVADSDEGDKIYGSSDFAQMFLNWTDTHAIPREGDQVQMTFHIPSYPIGESHE